MHLIIFTGSISAPKVNWSLWCYGKIMPRDGLHVAPVTWREPAFVQKWLFVNKGPVWRRWELVNLGGYKWIMRLSPTHSSKLSVYKNQLLHPLNLPQSVHTDPKELISPQGESPETHRHPNPFLLLNVILRLLYKLWATHFKLRFFGGKCEALSSNRDSAENFHSQDTRPGFFHSMEVVLEKSSSNPSLVFLPKMYDVTWPLMRKYQMDPFGEHSRK